MLNESKKTSAQKSSISVVRQWAKAHAEWWSAQWGILRANLVLRAERVYHSLILIAQASLAAGLSWWVALLIFPGTKPFFAPIAAIIALAPVPGRRIKRSFEIAAGTIAGVLVGELIIAQIGRGSWQISCVVAIAMIAALFLGSGMLVSVQAASSAILIATLIPLGGPGGLHRVWHAIIGSLLGILIMAIIPSNPIKEIRRQLAQVLNTEAQVLAGLAQGLAENNPDLISHALTLIRTTQPTLNNVRETLDNGSEVIRLSPLLWSSRHNLREWEIILEPLDNAVRNTRVLARRAVMCMEDHVTIDPRLIHVIDKLGEGTQVLHSVMSTTVAQSSFTAEEASRALISVAVLSSFALDKEDSSGLHGVVAHAQIRSIILDLLQVCGMDRTAALHAVPPIPGTRFRPA